MRAPIASMPPNAHHRDASDESGMRCDETSVRFTLLAAPTYYEDQCGEGHKPFAKTFHFLLL
jgi:hypothetical protein